MIIKNLKGQEVKWKPTGKEVLVDNRNRSSLHIRARKLLKDTFPTIQLLEEVQIEPIPYKYLYLDFYIPTLYIAIEIHGEQHYKFIPFLHGSRMKYIHGCQNDNMKREWCTLNNIAFIILPFNETDKQWKDQINGGNSS